MNYPLHEKRADMNLENRQARCSCGAIRPSIEVVNSWFEFRGEGSRFATETCGQPKGQGFVCAMYESAHPNNNCQSFIPRGPYEFDSFYCGHIGGQGT